jgi:hypothetical protein
MLPTCRCLLLLALGVMLTGCVERTVTITSKPTGALVYLNDQEVGRTPVTVPFTFYGKYDVRLEQDGYQTLSTSQDMVAPWWEFPGPDLIAEAVPNGKSRQAWHFELMPQPEPDAQRLQDRASQMRALTRQEPTD